MASLAAMFAHRPYVVGFLAAFAVLAYCERGALRAALWLVVGTFLGWASEYCSVTTGFPFGHYAYHKEQFAGEIWLGPVPLFASLSFAFLSYFSYSAARRLLGQWTGAGWQLAAAPVAPSAGGRAATAALAAIVGTWMDTVIDPVTLLGRYWFLGDLYHYESAGFHFGVPLSNYGGWLVTIGGIVLANEGIDALLARAGIPVARGPGLPFESLWGIACCAGVFAFILAVNAGLAASSRVPAEEPLGAILASGALSFALFLAFVAIMIRRGYRAAAGLQPGRRE